MAKINLALRAVRKAQRILTAPIVNRRLASTERLFASRHQAPDEYARYVRVQVRQTRSKARKDASFRLEPAIQIISEKCTRLSGSSPVLSIGARNVVELDIFARQGYSDVTAIDLWPTSRRIRQADMHAMPFPDDSFELLFASHAFEHSFDFTSVASECTRVLRPGGYIWCAVPVGFEPNEHDRIDFGDPEGLIHHFSNAGPNVLHESISNGEMRLLLQLQGAPAS